VRQQGGQLGRGEARPAVPRGDPAGWQHVKLDLKASILDSDLPDAAVFADRLREYFPAPLRERFPDAWPYTRCAGRS